MHGFESEYRAELWRAMGGKFRIIEDDTPCIALLRSRFPFGCRVEWNRVPGAKLLAAPPDRLRFGAGGDSPFSIEKHADAIREFIRRRATEHDIGADVEVVVLGDGVSFAFVTEIRQIILNCEVLFGYPQHVYVVPQNGDWCLNYTMEDDLYFGVSPGD